jgi:hypothetical protein
VVNHPELLQCQATIFTVSSHHDVAAGKLRISPAPGLCRAQPSRLNTSLPIGYFVTDTVCTTLATGRVLTVGTLTFLSSSSSYCASVCTGALGFIWTTL